MSNHIQQTIAELQEKIRKDEDAILNTKRVINELCGMAQLPLIYSDAELKIKSTASSMIRADQFFGRPLATVAREYLELRRNSNLGAATLEEIYSTLKNGGYQFEGGEDDARRGLAISMAKNTALFRRLPNSTWGLTDWYPDAKEDKEKAKGSRSKKHKPKIVHLAKANVPDKAEPIKNQPDEKLAAQA